jgi:O-antigen ligase
MNIPEKVQGIDKVIMNGLFMSLLIWGSFFFTNNSGDPGFAIRHLGISLFCLIYISYFILYRRYGYPSLTKWQLLSLFGYLMFTLVGLVSSFLGVNFREGIYPALINFNFIALLLITIHAFNIGLKLVHIAFLIALIGGFSGMFGILQYYNLLPEAFIVGSPPTALQFNRNFFGSSQVLILPFALISFLVTRGVVKYASITCVSIIIISISISQTRSAILSLLIFGAVVLITLLMHYSKGPLSGHRKSIIWMSIVVFLAGGGLLGLNYFGGVSKSIKKYLKSEEHTSGRQTSIEERLTIWDGSVEIVKSNPYLGVGFGNWKIHYAGNTNQPTRAKSGRLVIAKAHNVYLEILSETGIIGFSLYCLFLISISLIVFRTNLNNSSALLLGAGFFAFLSDYLFSFGNYQPSHMLYLGLMLGYIFYLGSSSQQKRINQKVLFLTGSITLILTFTAVYWSYSLLVFNQSIEKGQTSSSNGEFQMALYHFDNAVNNVHSLNRQGDSPHLQKALVYNKMKEFDKAIAESRIAWKDNPFSSRLNATFGASYFGKNNLGKAAVYYQNAFDVQSANMAIGEKLAICYFQMKDFRNCIEVLEPYEKYLTQNLKVMLQISRMNTGQKAVLTPIKPE